MDRKFGSKMDRKFAQGHAQLWADLGALVPPVAGTHVAKANGVIHHTSAGTVVSDIIK